MLVDFDLSVERPLAAADDQRTRAYDLFGDPLSVFLEFVGWQDGVDQAPFCRGARINPLAREQQLQCARLCPMARLTATIGVSVLASPQRSVFKNL
jgi:hypothetical protein